MALEAIDSDVIKTYVQLGLGVGIVAEMAVRGNAQDGLVTRPLGTCSARTWPASPSSAAPTCATSSTVRRAAVADRLDRNLIAKAMSGHVNDYDL